MEKLRKSKLSVMMLLLCTMLLVGSCEQEPTWQTLYDAGIQYTEEGNYDQAIASFEDAIALDANKPEAYSALADVYVAMENLEKALEVLQQGIDATGDDGLKARVEEISAKLEELAGPQKPEYMVDYLGMTVNEIAALWGEDYTVMDDLYLGDKKGIYYEDSRTMTGFYFLDPAGKGVQTGEEKIILIETSDDGALADGFPNNTTYSYLKAQQPNGNFYEDDIDGSSGCIYQLTDKITLLYTWDYNVDAETTPSVWARLYMEEPDTYVAQDAQNTQSTSTDWKSLYASELNYALSSASDPSMCQYYIYDIDGDGTPELFEGIGTSRADYTTYVYTARDGSLVRLGEMFGDQIGALDGQASVFGYYAQMGYEVVTVYSMANGSITEVSRYEKESPEGYTDFAFLPAFALDDLSGLNWTANSSSGNNRTLLNSF